MLEGGGSQYADAFCRSSFESRVTPAKQKKKKRGGGGVPRAAAWCSQVCGKPAAAARGSSEGLGRGWPCGWNEQRSPDSQCPGTISDGGSPPTLAEEEEEEVWCLGTCHRVITPSWVLRGGVSSNPAVWSLISSSSRRSSSDTTDGFELCEPCDICEERPKEPLRGRVPTLH